MWRMSSWVINNVCCSQALLICLCLWNNEAYMKKKSAVALSLLPLVVAVTLYFTFQWTDPAKVGPGGVLLVFVLIYLECLSILFVLLRFGVSLTARLLRGRSIAQSLNRPIGTRRAYYIASVIAFAPVVLLAMHAFSQVQWIDVALVAVLMVVATFYVVRRT